MEPHKKIYIFIQMLALHRKLQDDIIILMQNMQDLLVLIQTYMLVVWKEYMLMIQEK